MILTRTQIAKLNKIVEHFKEIDTFTFEENHESGIGPTVLVKFNLLDNKNPDTKIDITDVDSW